MIKFFHDPLKLLASTKIKVHRHIGGWAHEYTNQTLVVHGTNETWKLLDAAQHFYGPLYEEQRLKGLPN